MPRKSSKAAIPPSGTSHLFDRTGKAKDAHRSVTSESIAIDLQAFRKRGGRVEVLGNTPLRSSVNVTASRTKDSAQRKAAKAPKPAKAATRG
jgi:hypothetical protein